MTDKNSISEHEHHRSGRLHTLTGIAVSGAGAFWLTRNLGWIPVDASGTQILWPVLTIVLGLLFVFGIHKTRRAHGKKSLKN